MKIKNNVELVAMTKPVQNEIDAPQTAGELIAYCARVSNPDNQKNFITGAGLLKYCFEHQHWSIFEMVSVVFEVNTTRDIGRQILRHKSFSFQEFSQRYAKAPGFVLRECRVQDTSNRQNSFQTNVEELNIWWRTAQLEIKDLANCIYEEALMKGIAKEQARVILPEGMTKTKIYMAGTLRSFIHYCHLRKGIGTQKEHRYIAMEIQDILSKVVPEIKDILNEVNHGTKL